MMAMQFSERLIVYLSDLIAENTNISFVVPDIGDGNI